MAELVLPEVFTDNLVLQREQPIAVWGGAEPGATVSVAFAEHRREVTVDDDGRWRVELPAMTASAEARALRITDGATTRTLDNVLVGEVWLCSGQSNMALALKGADDAMSDIADANLPAVRLFLAHPNRKQPAEWTLCRPEIAGDWPAVPFFFARALHRDENVPVGIIVAAVGGTMIQSWIARDALAAHPDLRRSIVAAWDRELAAGRVKETPNATPGWCFEQSGLPTLAPYGLRGFVWYQGESNAWGFPIAERYRTELELLITDWRRRWDDATKPFLIVQLPHYPQAELPRTPSQMSPWCVVMETQWCIQDALPNVFTAVTIDLGKENDIHPTNKRPVGERLALLARAKTLGRDVVCQGPVFQEATFEPDGRVRLRFDSPVAANRVSGFTIAGDDRHFVWAEAVVEGREVICQSDAVPRPVAVRYAMTEHTAFTIYHGAGLPAGPFRTDDWHWDIPARDMRSAFAGRGEFKPAAGELTRFHTYRPAKATTMAAFAWDETALRARFDCREWGDGDTVDWLVDPNHDRRTYYRLTIRADGTWAAGRGMNDGRSDEDRLALDTMLAHYRSFSADEASGTAVAAAPDGVIEAAIPWTTLGVAPRQGLTLGLQFTRWHAATGERSEWAITGRDFNTGAMMPGAPAHHGVGRFGTLRLEEAE